MLRKLAQIVAEYQQKKPTRKTIPVAVTNPPTMTPPSGSSTRRGDGRPAIDWPAELARHDRWLRTVVAARTGEPQAVDEVMQEVALAAVRQQAPLVDRAKAAPWLYRLAVRQSLLYRRRMGRRRKLRDRYAERLEPDRESLTIDPLGWLLADERRELIRTAIRRLSPKETEILLLKYIEDWNYHQIAAHLGASHSAIEARLHRARGALRRQLAALNVIEATR
jgi:RNA polymerase sigma-70 factor (ECF subfamily)